MDTVEQQTVATVAQDLAGWDGENPLFVRAGGMVLDLMPRFGGYVEVARIIVPREVRRAGVGSAIMREVTAWADRTGTPLCLTPSTAHGATSVKRLTGFYRRFGFLPNRGRNKDFMTKEAMRRPAA